MRQLHFGCGTHKLPEPWENYDIEVDIRKPLPFATGSASFIFAEHVIEHVPFRDGLLFLHECKRVLAPGGVLRLSFPDILRYNLRVVELYAKFANELGKNIRTLEDAWLSVATDWGHQSVWTAAIAHRMLRAVGFQRARDVPYGLSLYPELRNIDGRHLSEGLQLAQAETSVIEGDWSLAGQRGRYTNWRKLKLA